jgi:type II secretory pathway component PulK
MEKVAMASSLAFAGTTLGRSPAFPADGHAEKQKFPRGGEIEVVVTSENGRLNINKVLAANDRDTLRALLRIWGLSDVEADTVVDCLLDYVEPGTTRRLNGAKALQYRQANRPPPPGRLFRSIEEMASVLNFDLVTNRKADWRDFFTIYGDGTLDLTAAPADLIRAVCRVGDSGARAVLQCRAGEGASLNDLDAARIAMGLTEKEFSAMGDKVSLGGRVRRIRSQGSFAQTRRTIEAVCRMDNEATALLEWREW